MQKKENVRLRLQFRRTETKTTFSSVKFLPGLPAFHLCAVREEVPQACGQTDSSRQEVCRYSEGKAGRCKQPGY